MIAPARETPSSSSIDQQQSQFVCAILPAIERRAGFAFRNLPPEEQEESVAATVALAWSWFVRLCQRGKDASLFPTVLAKYAVLRVREGRQLGTALNRCDLLSNRTRQYGRFDIESLERDYENLEPAWRDALSEDGRTAIPDQAAFRIDFPEWLSRLTERGQRVAEYLALGHLPSEAAERFRVSRARISQMRRQLAHSWDEFHGEGKPRNGQEASSMPHVV